MTKDQELEKAADGRMKQIEREAELRFGSDLDGERDKLVWIRACEWADANPAQSRKPVGELEAALKEISAMIVRPVSMTDAKQMLGTIERIADEALRSVETKPESVIGKCIEKPIKDEALTAEDGERLANEHVENYLTMNGRPVHRPDVLKHSFLAGYRSRDVEIESLYKELAAHKSELWKAAHAVKRFSSKLERMESLVRKAVDFSRRANAGETQDCDGYSMLHYYDKVWVPDASQALKDEVPDGL